MVLVRGALQVHKQRMLSFTTVGRCRKLKEDNPLINKGLYHGKFSPEYLE